MELKINSIYNKVWYKVVPSEIKKIIQNDANLKLPANASLSFSQEGEDLILNRIFGHKKTGFYIDIGAHNPIRFSNTYAFYKRGWRGVNIDAMPGSMEEFNIIRPEDTNLEIPISDTVEELTYYIFNEKALNTFSEKEAKKKDGLNGFKILEKKKLRTQTLGDVLGNIIQKEIPIDFMSVDVEGFDLKVLMSNDWERFKPKVLLVEDLDRRPLDDMRNSLVYSYLKDIGYIFICKTFNTLFFELKN